MAFILLLLDLVDGLGVTGTYAYQIPDKVIDLGQFIVSYYLVRDTLSPMMKKVIFWAIIWRAIGVYMIHKTRNLLYLIVFADFIKELYVINYLSIKLNWDNRTIMITMIIMAICKIVFEYRKQHQAMNHLR
jgi:hypothetical protein